MLVKKGHIDEKFLSIDLFNMSYEDRNKLLLLIKNIFLSKKIIFRATGLWDNIEQICINLCNCRQKKYDGDKNRFFIKRYPEIQIDIDDVNLLDNVFDTYVNTIYEGRYLYFLSNHNSEKINKLLENNIYMDENLFELLKEYIDCLIENMRECDDGFSISMIIRKNLLDNFDSLFLDNI